MLQLSGDHAVTVRKYLWRAIGHDNVLCRETTKGKSSVDTALCRAPVPSVEKGRARA